MREEISLPFPEDEIVIIECRYGVLGVHLHEPGLLVLVLLVHVQLDEVHLQVEGLDAHEDGPAVRGAWKGLLRAANCE